jgi:hypothetical protein
MTTTNPGQLPTAPLAGNDPYYQSYAAGPTFPNTGYAPAAPAVDPARTLGIAGLVLSIFFSAVGLVVSIVAFRKSKRAGFKNTPALAGIVVGIITTVGILTAGIAGGLAATSLVSTCADLGPGQHVVNGVTYTCG